ncbi:MAG: glycosyltransferase family 2 protein [Hyphomicrobiaceae bacterium]|nr:MAG: glycosyltransferase family 2 protein [Hyphomicrobiaceae bacterium]
MAAEAGFPALSLVAPCFNEQDCLQEFHRRASAACEEVAGDDYEIVLVDDGSHDDTWQVIQSLSQADSRVVGVHLMRNHGHQLAATAGLFTAQGERVMLIDADLQDPPELLASMMEKMDRGADVVYGRRTLRDGETWFKKASAAAFYRLLSRIANVPIPEDTGDFRLMRRRVVEALLAMPERERFLRGMVSWIGGHQVPIDYARDPRHAGRTKYSLGKMLRFGTDAVTSFSIAPLRFAVWLGLMIAGLAMLLLVYSLWRWLSGEVVTGWTSIMTAIALFSGVQLLVLGIMGEYLGRLVQEAKGRPLFLIDSLSVEGRSHRVPSDFWRMPRRLQQAMLSELAPKAKREKGRDQDTVRNGSSHAHEQLRA